VSAPHKAHPAKVMIWGAVGYNFKGSLHFVHQATVNWEYYHDEIILGPGVLDAADSAYGHFDWFLTQDNARPHICKAMMEALSNLAVRVLPNWPPYSPDLNIIEVIWAIMKRRVEAQHPTTMADLRRVVLDVWENLSLVTINGLIAQMPARVAKVIEGNGHIIQHLSR
jgi:hypothetical protein